MQNIVQCRCRLINDKKYNIRNHHGIVCTSCNPNRIDPLLVPNTIPAYRIWNYSHEYGFVSSRRNNVSRSNWNVHNTHIPPGFKNEDDFFTPWSLAARCDHYSHNAPNPYCSCGYYSVKQLGINNQALFNHDSSQEIIRRFDKVFKVIESLNETDKKLIAELFFYSPVIKTYELISIPVVSKVDLKGIIIECENGYRSEYVKPNTIYLLLRFKELFIISSYLGNILGKDVQESFHTTYKWIEYLENYFRNVSTLYGLNFELLFSLESKEKNYVNNSNINIFQIDNYAPFKYHKYINEVVKPISEVVESANTILNNNLPNLKQLLTYKLSDTQYSNVIDMYRAQRAYKGNIDYRQWEGRYRSIESFNSTRFNLNEFYDMYFEILISFALINLSLQSKTKSKGHILKYPDYSKDFGFNYHSYVEHKYEAEKLDNDNFDANHHPRFWFPTLNGLLNQKVEVLEKKYRKY